MHDTAREFGGLFFSCYWKDEFTDILDVGSSDIGGTLRDVAPAGARYTGIDMVAGPGVDVVLEDSTKFPFPDDTFDAVVSTSCLEHDVMFWVTFLEMLRVAKNGGYVYLDVPSNGMFHRYPVDCWRFYPDAGIALEKWAGRHGMRGTLLESFIADRRRDQWNDCVMVFGKGDAKPGVRFMSHRGIAARNIRRFGELQITNFTGSTEDQDIQAALMRRRKIRGLRRFLGRIGLPFG